MQRDAQAPSVRSCPDRQRREGDQHRHTQRRVRAHDAEIDHDNHHTNWQTVADDGERPGVAGVSCEYETAG